MEDGVNSFRVIIEISISSYKGVSYFTGLGHPIAIKWSFHALPDFVYLGILRFGSTEMQTKNPITTFLIYQIKWAKRETLAKIQSDRLSFTAIGNIDWYSLLRRLFGNMFTKFQKYPLIYQFYIYEFDIQNEKVDSFLYKASLYSILVPTKIWNQIKSPVIER